MKLLIETENQPINMSFDTSDFIIDFSNNKNFYISDYNIKLYNIENTKKDLIATIKGTYFDIIYNRK